MELNPTLEILLKGIGQSLEEMDHAELATFAQQWQELIQYVDRKDAGYDQFLDKLKNLIAASPTLTKNGFSDALAAVPRYRPDPEAPTPPNPTQGLPPVHNEVVKIGTLLQGLLPNKTKP